MANCKKPKPTVTYAVDHVRSLAASQLNEVLEHETIKLTPELDEVSMRIWLITSSKMNSTRKRFNRP